MVSQVVSNRKQEYFNNIVLKLNNSKTSAKTYWSILKTFYNGKKIPVIPLLLIKNELVSNFKTKAKNFNIFFASQCTPLDNYSTIPGNQTYVTDNKLSSLQFEDCDIIKIIRSLDTSKAHGHNDISYCALSLYKGGINAPKNCKKRVGQNFWVKREGLARRRIILKDEINPNNEISEIVNV